MKKTVFVALGAMLALSACGHKAVTNTSETVVAPDGSTSTTNSTTTNTQ